MTFAPAECPLCNDHTRHDQACEFTNGSLYCIRRDCTNPHHRPQPEAKP